MSALHRGQPSTSREERSLTGGSPGTIRWRRLSWRLANYAVAASHFTHTPRPGADRILRYLNFPLDQRRRQGRSDDRADPGDRGQPVCLFVLLRPADEFSIEGCDPSIELRALRAGSTSRIMRGLKLALPCLSISTFRNSLSGFVTPRPGCRISVGAIASCSEEIQLCGLPVPARDH